MVNAYDDIRFLPVSHVTTSNLRRRSDHIARTVRSLGDQPLQSLREPDLLSLLDNAEGICRITRQALSEKDRMQPYSDCTIRQNRPEIRPLPLDISFFDGILRIYAPLTYHRDMKSSWYLADCLGISLREYSQQRGPIVLEPPVYAVVRRRVPTVTASMRDNENLEVSRMLNAIFCCLGYSDRCDRTAYASLAESSNVGHGTFITIIQASRIAEIIDELIPGGLLP